MRLANLDEEIFVPIEDEQIGTSYEMKMTLGDFLDKFCAEFKPEIIEAIPIRWIEEHQEGDETCVESCQAALRYGLVDDYRKFLENEEKQVSS